MKLARTAEFDIPTRTPPCFDDEEKENLGVSDGTDMPLLIPINAEGTRFVSVDPILTKYARAFLRNLDF